MNETRVTTAAKEQNRIYGLIGAKLAHSHSPMIHSLFGNYDYRLYELGEEALSSFLSREDLGGVNVTIPYKRTVMKYCCGISQKAADMGCVNTLVRREEGLYGHNTDCDGFLYMAKRAGVSFAGKKVIILGTGGTSGTASYGAKLQGAREVVLISRQGENNYDNLHKHRDGEILVNTTPVGMFPRNEEAPLSLSEFPKLSGVLDVIYNPLKTRLILEAEERGIPCSGGLAMLVRQAHGAAELFTGHEIPEERVEAALDIVRRRVENIVLIGMAGCGKTAVGGLVSQALGRTFIDTDEKVEQEAGIPIPQIFESQGEAAFRKREAEAVFQASRMSGVVIATGGGAVLNLENRRALQQNGRIFFLRRPVKDLPREGRPLSMNAPDLEAMYQERLPVYLECCHDQIHNTGSLQGAADQIIKEYRNP